MNRRWIIIGLTGFMGSPSDPGCGVHQILDNVRRLPNAVGTIGFGYRFCPDALLLMRQATRDHNRLILVGHSWGAHAAIALTQKYKKEMGVWVQALYTVDAVHRWWGLWPRPCREGAAVLGEHRNYYQVNTTIVHGGPIETATFNQQCDLCTHADIDNKMVPVISAYIRRDITNSITRYTGWSRGVDDAEQGS